MNYILGLQQFGLYRSFKATIRNDFGIILNYFKQSQIKQE